MACKSSTMHPLFGDVVSTAFPVRFQALLHPSPSHTPPCSSGPSPARADAISVWFWYCFGQDVSNIHEVPDHQEVLVDPAHDESLIFELLDLRGVVGDGGDAL
ncbi:hypothetical protein D1007_38245 [Hordeum vulgare]|nr:hypothetical protein D1007_38245 [Hordeum vulgare]